MTSRSQDGLAEQADRFARGLAHLVSAFTGTDVHFVAKASTTGERFTVAPEGPVSIMVGELKLLSLEIGYQCRFDRAGRYMSVHQSTIKVHAGPRPKGEPLFRYEFVHDQSDGLPGAHLHVHAHRDHFTALMTRAEIAGAKRRQGRAETFDVLRMASLHFPVGGPRFRPGLEDVLEFLAVELGAATGPHWQSTLQASRAAYRRDQVGAAVRDCPSVAARVLTELGFTVTPPAGAVPPDNDDRLTAF